MLEQGEEAEPVSAVSAIRRALVIDLYESDSAPGRPGAAWLNRWLAENPGDTGAREVLAATLTENGAFAEAATQYELLLAQVPDEPYFHNNLAWSYQQLGDGRALMHAEYAYELEPNDGEIADTLGWVLTSRGEAERGVALLRDAHILRPGDPEIAYHLAYALSRTGREGEAVTLLERLLNSGMDPVREAATALLVRLRQDQ